MSIQEAGVAKENPSAEPGGEKPGGDRDGHEVGSYSSAKTGIATSAHMVLAIDEIYRSAASGNATTPAQQANTMLNAIGKMLAVENLRLRAGQYADRRGGNGQAFFLGSGSEESK